MAAKTRTGRLMIAWYALVVHRFQVFGDAQSIDSNCDVIRLCMIAEFKYAGLNGIKMENHIMGQRTPKYILVSASGIEKSTFGFTMALSNITNI